MFKRPYLGLASACVILAAGAAAALPLIRPAAVAAAETPRTAQAIPMFPGLTAAGEDPIEFGGLMDWNDPYPLIEGRKRSYTTTATAEEVFAFYQQRLGGKIEHDESDSHSNIGPGGVTPVVMTRYPYAFEDTENPMTNRRITAASQRALLSGGRPPSVDGDWIRDGSFDWVVKDRTGAPTEFHVKVIDASVAPNWTGYAAKTTVEVYVSRYGLIADD